MLWALTAVVSLGVAAPPRAAASASALPSAEAAPGSGQAARWIAVSVATLWAEPGLARPVDAPSESVPADPRGWIAGMSVAQKRWLVGKLETQALLGDEVHVLATHGDWSRVAAAGQPTPRQPLGYPGWLPSDQLSAVPPASAPRVAVIAAPTVWLRDAPAGGRPVLEVSYDTRLPAVSLTPAVVEVVIPGGTHAYVRRSAVRLLQSGQEQRAPSGARVVAEARRFLGLQYLWAGTSGFGFDCSGFTYSVFRQLGVTIPRDAGPQASVGRSVTSRRALRAGDLVFFRDAGGAIHHVGICVGGGRMIHSPGTGLAVQEVSLASPPYASEFCGGRRLTR